ncbi:MAG: chromate efflux transporter [Rhodospirillales bacterium]|nr:chromate efflux transporter [Rhodospirillales bacterium]
MTGKRALASDSSAGRRIGEDEARGPASADNAALAAPPSLGQALRTWAKIGLISFGGPAGQIALMHRIVVDDRHWVDEPRFLHALNFCMLLPGPEAQQLAVYLGWLMHGTSGGLAAGILFVLPGALVMLALSMLYVLSADLPAISGVFWGIKAAVLAIVVEAILRIGRRALRNPALYTLAGAAFAALFFFSAPFPVIILAAGMIGAMGVRRWPAAFAPPGGGDGDGNSRTAKTIPTPSPHARRSSSRWVTAGLGAVLWFGPTAAIALALGSSSAFTDIGIFFSKMAVVTFGGAYAVLTYVAQQAVATYHWLAPGEMLTGLGLAETTPGPLIMVVQFVAFLGAYRAPGGLEPMTAGILGAMLATWVTFVPCFLWIFLGAPYIERLRGNRRLTAALTAITAAVVGVILNLALWFALHVLFTQLDDWHAGPLRLLVPDFASLDPRALALTVAAMIAMLRFKIGVLPILAAAAMIGILLRT